MNWLPRFAVRDAGSTTGRGRLFVYLALTVIALLLSYQLVLNHESLSVPGKGWTHAQYTAGTPEDGKLVGGDGSRLASQEIREKELVLAAMSYSNMSWVQENVPNWYTNIYRADVRPGKAGLTVPVNKGNEAMAFLT